MHIIAYLDDRPVAWLTNKSVVAEFPGEYQEAVGVIQLFTEGGGNMATKKTAKKTSKTTKKH
jgi:hypothetical protein